MKSRFLPGVLLCVLALPCVAQQAAPPAQAAPSQPSQNTNINITQEKLDALAAPGAFYEMVRRATSFSGRFTSTRTTVKDGVVVAKQVLQYQSTFVGDGDGRALKEAAQGAYTVTLGSGENAVTTVQKYRTINDGTTQYQFFEGKNLWEQKPSLSLNNRAAVVTFASLSQFLAYIAIFRSGDFQVSLRPNADGTLLRVISGGGTTGIYDARSGLMQSLVGSPKDNVTSEMMWEDVKLNQPVDPNLFVWSAPQGSQEVPYGTTVLNFEIF